MNAKEHIRSACWCFFLAMAFVVLMISAPGADAHQVAQLTYNDHFFSEADDDLPVTEVFAEHAKPKHSAVRVKTKVFLNKVAETPLFLSAPVSYYVHPDQASPDTDNVRPAYYDFLFRYTPF